MTTTSPLIEVGELALVWTDCNRSGWKLRPAVIVDVSEDTVSVVPLTSDGSTPAGNLRPQLDLAGLRTTSYIWCPRLQLVQIDDVGRRLGWLDEDSLLTLIKVVRMPPAVLRRLQLAVYHRRRSGW